MSFSRRRISVYRALCFKRLRDENDVIALFFENLLGRVSFLGIASSGYPSVTNTIHAVAFDALGTRMIPQRLRMTAAPLPSNSRLRRPWSYPTSRRKPSMRGM